MDSAEIRKHVALEGRHWWHRERRAILDREVRRLGPPGRALDVGAAGGGNCEVLRSRGWKAIAADYSAVATEIARERGLDALRADARDLPLSGDTFDLVIAMDVLEHIDEDNLASEEIARVLKPGGRAFITVPCGLELWSAHDVALGHVRRYTRESLTEVVEKAGLVIDDLWSWNVLLRPVAKWRRRSSTGCDLDDPHPVVNAALTVAIVAERYLPVRSLPGVSLMLRARKLR